MVSNTVARWWCVLRKEVSVSWVVEEFSSELLEEVAVVVLKGGEVKGGEGFLVGGVARAQDHSSGSLLNLLQLTTLGQVQGRRPSRGRVGELG